MGVEQGVGLGSVGQPEEAADGERKDVVELRTNLEKELGISGAVEAICIYLTKNFALMVTAEDIRSTLGRDGLTVREVEEMLRKADFRRVQTWELDSECARLADNVQKAVVDGDRRQREEVLERYKSSTAMQEPAIQNESSVWARQEGKESEQQWLVNGKTLGEVEINELVRDHITDLGPSFF